MIKKFWYLVRYGLKKKFKSKSFIISNIILFILLIGFLNIDKIIGFFGGTFDEETNIYIIDNTLESYDLLVENYDKVKFSIDDNKSINFIKSDEDIDKLNDKIKGTTDIIVLLDIDNENFMKANIITENYIDTLIHQSLIQSINNTKYQVSLMKSNIDIEELNKISNPVNIERTILDETKNTEEENMNTVMSVVFPTIILPFFMLIVLLVQMIGGEINEEKTTKSMEVIISNVSAKTHFFSKLVSNNIFVIVQAIMLFGYGAIGLLLRNVFTTDTSSISSSVNDLLSTISNSGIIDKLYYLVPITIILMILSFVAYSLIAGILASMTVNTEDFQHIQTPIMIICIISYYLAIMSSMFNGSLFIRILSYIPLISCLLSPALLTVGQITIFDCLFSIVLLILLIFVLIKYGLRIYKIGILNYSQDKMWTRIFKATKM